jgi:hypothetical protein
MFVKVENYIINVDQITYIDASVASALKVYFVGGISIDVPTASQDHLKKFLEEHSFKPSRY